MSAIPGDSIVYDRVARRLHWANASLALATVMLAWCILGAPRHGGARGLLVTLHASFGLTMFGLVLFWSAWRRRHPAPPLPLAGVEVWLARATQTAMLLLFAAMAVSGYLGLAAAGRSVSLFGVVAVPPLAPQSGRLSQVAIALHVVGEFLLYGLVALHIGAALMHGFIRRDGILERMLPRP